MPGSEAVKERIEQLIADAPQLSGQAQEPRQRAWLVAAQNAVQLVCSSSDNPYYTRGQELIRQGSFPHRAFLGWIWPRRRYQRTTSPSQCSTATAEPSSRSAA
jgi:hypothetical protein